MLGVDGKTYVLSDPDLKVRRKISKAKLSHAEAGGKN